MSYFTKRRERGELNVHISIPLPTFDPQLACAAAQGFALLEGNSIISYVAQPLAATEVSHTRFNDGACDSAGRFFAGTIASPEHNVSGELYRYDPAAKTCVKIDGPFTVGNVVHPPLPGSVLNCLPRTVMA